MKHKPESSVSRPAFGSPGNKGLVLPATLLETFIGTECTGRRNESFKAVSSVLEARLGVSTIPD